MKLNNIIFPAPFPPSYISSDDLMPKAKLIFVPEKPGMKEDSKRFNDEEDKSSRGNKYSKQKGFPCWYIPFTEGSNKIIMYFHGNAEDIGQSTKLMDKLSTGLKCHVIGVEYPGYGICFRETKDAQTIKIRAKRTYDFLTQEFGFDEEDIIVFGRSIGSGPVVDLAAQTHPCALVLMSAYTSLK